MHHFFFSPLLRLSIRHERCLLFIGCFSFLKDPTRGLLAGFFDSSEESLRLPRPYRVCSYYGTSFPCDRLFFFPSRMTLSRTGPWTLTSLLAGADGLLFISWLPSEEDVPLFHSLSPPSVFEFLDFHSFPPSDFWVPLSLFLL